ncbi:MAG: hypothetical protein ACKVPJ_03850 [Chitinophagales bacterium]
MKRNLLAYCFYFFFLSFSSCNPQGSLQDIELPILGNPGETFSGKSISAHAATVFVFLSPECPLSEAYTKTISNLFVSYKDSSVQFVSVFAGKLYSKEQILSFRRRFDLPGQCIEDETMELVKLLEATVTPEAFLISNKSEIIYSGAIDNWAVDLGTKRQNITEKYLENAIAALLKGESPQRKKTQAVGCFIE